MSDTPHNLIREIRGIIEASQTRSERSLQTWIGPSQVGTSCNFCLVEALAERRSDQEFSMYQLLGTAIHEYLEVVFMRDELQRADSLGALHTNPRWQIERRVTVGAITDPRDATKQRIISGRCDLYTPACGGVVIDWKLKGKAGIAALRRDKVPPIMRHQLNLYGLGYELAGEPVKWLIGYGLPRVGGRTLTMADAAPVVMPYDRDDALTTLARADSWARVIAAYGVQAALDLAGPHTGEEYSCGDWDDAPPPKRAKEKAPLTLLPAETRR